MVYSLLSDQSGRQSSPFSSQKSQLSWFISQLKAVIIDSQVTILPSQSPFQVPSIATYEGGSCILSFPLVVSLALITLLHTSSVK